MVLQNYSKKLLKMKNKLSMEVQGVIFWECDVERILKPWLFQLKAVCWHFLNKFFSENSLIS